MSIYSVFKDVLLIFFSPLERGRDLGGVEALAYILHYESGFWSRILLKKKKKYIVQDINFAFLSLNSVLFLLHKN